MDKGRIEQIGTPEEVYEHPATPFVYHFLGNVNLFHGHIHAGQARLGEFKIEVPEYADAQDIPAVGYVRPYDIAVERHRNGTPAIEALVSHIQRIGSLVHLELTRGDTGDLIEVELSKERYWDMQIAQGERVFITPRQLKVFVQDH